MNKRKWQSLLVAVAIPEAIGAIAGLISGPAMLRQNRELIMPPLAPPPWLFPVVWVLLYLLLGLAAWLVWRKKSAAGKRARGLYGLQLFCNFLWPIVFFNFQQRLFAFFWLLVLLALIFATMRAFGHLDKRAGWLLAPYLLWCCFAAYLNLAIYLLNG